MPPWELIQYGRRISKKVCLAIIPRVRVGYETGTLRNYYGDVRKSNRFNEQNNNSARASRFFVHFFAVPGQLDVK